MKILLAVDGSDYTSRALDHVMALDWLRLGNSLTVFTVVLPVSPLAASMAGSELTHGYYESEAEQVLGRIRPVLPEGAAAIDTDWVVGHVAPSIVRKAEGGRYDLIVLGSQGRGALANMALGSVATRVLATCKLPVLLIR